MAEASIVMRGPLDGRSFEDGARSVRIEALPQGAVLQVVKSAGATIEPGRLRAAASQAGLSVGITAPGLAWFIGDSVLSHEALRDVAAALGPAVHLIDQSHGKARIALTGAGVRAVLASGLALDLSDRAFPVGSWAEAQFGAIPVGILRVAADRYQLVVARSFARSLWADLLPPNAA